LSPLVELPTPEKDDTAKPRHSAACKRGATDKDCPLCYLIIFGRGKSKVRTTRQMRERAQDAMNCRAVALHDCVASKCGPVCTAFD
jgi:hypothetical protein